MMTYPPPAARRFGSLLVAVLMTSACSGWGTAADPSPAQPAVAASAPPPHPVAAPDAALEQRIAALELQLLEKDAQVDELRVRLDDARREVVRAMAKLQSAATRAEAASGMAEAEIALEALGVTAAAPAGTEVSGLIQSSTAEFDRQNYGGALYLANQAKSAAAAARGQLAGVEQGATRPGEQPFALPLQLQTTANANVRGGPGTGFEVLFTLPPGASLTGYSSAERWLRVADDSGRRGWIFQNLIRGRP